MLIRDKKNGDCKSNSYKKMIKSLVFEKNINALRHVFSDVRDIFSVWFILKMHKQAFNSLVSPLLSLYNKTKEGGKGAYMLLKYSSKFAQKSNFAHLLFRHKHVVYDVISRISNFCQVQSKRGNTSKLTQFWKLMQLLK